MTTKGRLIRQAWMTAEDTLKVMHALGEARFVGGCVRDALCNRKVIDIDIATPLRPEEVIARLQKNGIKYAPTGLRHGTVTAIVNGRPFEITTLREDVNAYGRHADVKFTDSWEADAARRDFTINAMSATLEEEVFDPFGGIGDLREGRVLFVGAPEERIREDILRILRFFRFHAHFGKGPPDAAALSACRKMAAQITRLSPERIRQEVLKLLESDCAADTWRIMLENGIVTHFLPEATNVAALERLIALENRHQGRTFALRRLAALLDVNREGLEHVAAALRLSNDQAAQLRTLLFPQADVSTTMDHAEVRRLVYRAGNDATRSLLLLAAAREGEENDLANLYNWATTFRPPRFPLQGQDALALGHRGPEVGRVLRAMERWWLEEDFRPGRTMCLEKMKAEFGAP